MNGPYDPPRLGDDGGERGRGGNGINPGRVASPTDVGFSNRHYQEFPFPRVGSSSPTSVAAIYDPMHRGRRMEPHDNDDLDGKISALPGAYDSGGDELLSPKTRDALPAKMKSYDHHKSMLKKAAPVLQNVMIEIAPGVKVRLRGSKETRAAIERDFFIPALCFGCSLNLFCIMDANYVVCPACRVVSPLEGGADLDYQGGVGLGFTWEDLQEWQDYIRRNQERGGW